MIIKKVLKRFRDVREYIEGYRVWYGFRYLFKKLFLLPSFIKTVSGSKFYVGREQLDETIIKDLFRSLRNTYFPTDLVLKEGDVVLDVGAHKGFYSVELCKRFPGSVVYSFEPFKKSYKRLLFHKKINKAAFTPVNAALSDNTGEAFIVDSDEGSWGNYVSDSVQDNTTVIRTISVKDFLSENKISSIALLKLNAEGAEFAVLPEMMDNNIFPSCIILFAHPEKGNVKGLVEMVIGHGYEIKSSFDSERRPWYVLQRQ